MVCKKVISCLWKNKDKIIQQKQTVIKENESEDVKKKNGKRTSDRNKELLNSMIGEDKITEKKINSKILSLHSKTNIIVKLR